MNTFNNITLPKGWEVKRVKDVCASNEKSLSEITNKDFDFEYIDISNVTQDGITTTETMCFANAPSRARRIIRKNDTIVSTVRTYLRAIAYIDFEPMNYIVSTGFAVLSPRKRIIPKFLSYYSLSENFISSVMKESTGTSYPAINASKLVSLSIPLPPLPIQTRIAAYLDEKTAQIDHRIALLNAKADKYRTLRRSIINQAVTQGLEPNPVLKPSGIKWIENIPQGWEVKRVKDVFNFTKGLSITKENLEEKGIPVISYGQIHSKQNTGVKIDDFLIRYVNESYLKTDKKSLANQYDFLFADTSEDIEGCGNCVYVDKKILLFAGYHTLILKSKKNRNNKYLAYLFNSDDWRFQIRTSVCGVKLYSITQKNLGSVPISLPPLPVQTQIAAYLDEKTAQIDAMVSNIQKQVEQLNTLRRSIIDQAVTGQISEIIE